jgi:membrane protease YdiL (CAAX protease family)
LRLKEDGNMKKVNILSLLALVTAFHYVALYCEIPIYNALNLQNAPLLWSMLFSSGVILLAVYARRLIAQKFPLVMDVARERLTHERSSSFLSFKGSRKTVIIIAVYALIGIASVKVGQFQNRITGGEPERDITIEEYSQVQSSLLGKDLDSRQTLILAYGKRLTGLVYAAFAEEMLYRWLVLTLLLGVMRRSLAVGLSTLAFGLAHFFAPYATYSQDFGHAWALVTPAAIMGIAYSIAYLKGGMSTALFFHVTTNIFPVFKDEAWLNYPAYAIAVILLVLAPLLILEACVRRFLRRSA